MQVIIHLPHLPPFASRLATCCTDLPSFPTRNWQPCRSGHVAQKEANCSCLLLIQLGAQKGSGANAKPLLFCHLMPHLGVFMSDPAVAMMSPFAGAVLLAVAVLGLRVLREQGLLRLCNMQSFIHGFADQDSAHTHLAVACNFKRSTCRGVCQRCSVCLKDSERYDMP